MDAVGAMPMPEGFRYRSVALRGKPRHDRFDDFRLRHPGMDPGHRAKIFAPFDALKGFGEAVAARGVLYAERREPDPEAAEELDRRLRILLDIARRGRASRVTRPRITVTYFEPCRDGESGARGARGLYRTVTGVFGGMDPETEGTVLAGSLPVRIGDILSLESEDGIFLRPEAPEESA